MKDDDRPRAAVSRRRVLGTIAVGSLGIAGCLGSGSGTGDGAENPPVAGDPDASVTLESFEDFSCGACRQYTLDGFPLLADSHVEPGLIRYEFRNFPFIGDTSFEAANAARAVLVEGGDEAFWEFKKRVMENQAQLTAGSAELYGDIAADLEVDREPVETAAIDQEYEDAVSADKSRGEDLGVDRTPSFAIDGELVDTSGAASVQGLVGIVQDELNSAVESVGDVSGRD